MDVQLVSGFAVVCTAVIRMAKGKLSAYHFNILQDLAWLSNNSHLLSSRLIHAWLGKKEQEVLNTGSLRPIAGDAAMQRNRQGGRSIYVGLHLTRFTLTTSMLAFMFALSLWGGSVYVNDWFNCPATCVLFQWPGSTAPVGGQPEAWMIVSIVLLGWAYVAALGNMLGPTGRRWSCLRDWTCRQSQQKLPWWLYEALIYVLGFLDSTLFETMFQIVWFGLGVYWLVGDWNDGQQLLQQPAEAQDYLACTPFPDGESEWGFGQFFALFVLLVPLLALVDVYEDRKHAETVSTHSTGCGKSSVIIKLNAPEAS